MNPIFFDLVGTLIRARASLGNQYAAVAARFDIEADPLALDRVFGAVLARFPTFVLPGSAPTDLAMREKLAWRAIVETVFVEAGYKTVPASRSFDDYFEALLGHFATGNAWDVYPDVPASLERLKRAGHPIGLVSNFDSRIFPLLDRLRLASAFDSITIPALAGAAKPDPVIFRHALASHGAAADAAVFVGDSVVDDVLPALEAGMRAILIDRDGVNTAPAGIRRVRSLEEVPDLT